jgi:hypothetical protein
MIGQTRRRSSIVEATRRAAVPQSEPFFIEPIVPADPGPDSKMLDIPHTDATWPKAAYSSEIRDIARAIWFRISARDRDGRRHLHRRGVRETDLTRQWSEPRAAARLPFDDAIYFFFARRGPPRPVTDLVSRHFGERESACVLTSRLCLSTTRRNSRSIVLKASWITLLSGLCVPLSICRSSATSS